MDNFTNLTALVFSEFCVFSKKSKGLDESHISEGLRPICAGSIASKNFEAYNYVIFVYEKWRGLKLCNISATKNGRKIIEYSIQSPKRSTNLRFQYLLSAK